MTLIYETKLPDAVGEFCQRNDIGEMPKDAIADFRRRHRIRLMATFDAEHRDIFHLGDNDIYVDFKREHERRSESDLNTMQAELRDILGVEICLKTGEQMSNWLVVAFYPAQLMYAERN